MERETIIRIAAILETLDETPGGEAPSGAIYAALGMPGMSAYTGLLARMANAGLISRTPTVVRILEQGRTLAAEIRDAREGGER